MEKKVLKAFLVHEVSQRHKEYMKTQEGVEMLTCSSGLEGA